MPAPVAITDGRVASEKWPIHFTPVTPTAGPDADLAATTSSGYRLVTGVVRMGSSENEHRTGQAGPMPWEGGGSHQREAGWTYHHRL
jgi:hypothetical protein